MNMYTLLKAANRTTDNDKIFEQVEAIDDFAFIEDYSSWKIVGHDEPLEIVTLDTATACITYDPILPPNSIKAETMIADNLIIAGKEFDDIINSIVSDALEEERKYKTS